MESSLTIKKKQKHDFKVLSDKKCAKCGQPLKQNLVDRSRADKCYTCYLLSRGKTTLRIRKLKNTEREQVKIIDLIEKQKANKRKFLY